MPNKFSLNVQPPLGGIKRDLAFQEQEPFTGVEILNLWGHDPDTGREVLATRPPLAPFESPEPLFIGPPLVNMFCRVSGNVEGLPQQGLTCAANQQVFYWDGAAWVAAVPAAAEVVDADRAVFAAPFLHWVFIANSTAMLVYDYNDNSLETAVATAGTFPLDARVAATFLGTLWVGGTPGEENVLKGSRTGDPFDWDFTFDDEGAPFQATGENAGIINEAITALIPRTSDSMVVAGPTSMMIMYGHPSRGGLLEGVSTTLGVLGQGAWCKLPDDTIYFLSVHGMGKLGPGNGATPELVSDTAIPESLKGIVYDQLDPKITMAYDSRFQKIYINVRDDQQQGWVFDTKHGSFMRQTFSDYPYAMIEFPPFVSFNNSGVLWGGTKEDGITRFERLGTETDRPFWRAFIGPVKISNDAQKKSIIDRVRVVLGKNANDPRGMVSFFTGTDGEDAFTRAYNNIAVTRSIYSLLHLQQNAGWCSPKLSGHALVIVVSGGNEGKFILEGMNMSLTENGANNMLRSIGYGYGIGEGVDFYNPGFGGGFDNNFGDDGSPDVGPWEPDDDDPFEDAEDSDGVIIPGPPTVSGGPGFATFSMAAPPEGSMSGFVHSMPLSLVADDGFWNNLREDGFDLRVTDDVNNPIPFDVIGFDKEAKLGHVLVKADQDGSVSLKVWNGTGNTELPAPDAVDGRYAVYDDLLAFWPDGAFNDRTVNGYSFTFFDNPPAETTGLNGFPATNWIQDNAGEGDLVITTGNPLSITFLVRYNNTLDSGTQFMFQQTPTGEARYLRVGGTIFNRLLTFNPDPNVDELTSGDGLTIGAWAHVGGTWPAADTGGMWRNGNGGTGAPAPNSVGSTNTFLVDPTSTGPGFSMDLSMLMIHAVNRSGTYMENQADMLREPESFFANPPYTEAVWPN